MFTAATRGVNQAVGPGVRSAWGKKKQVGLTQCEGKPSNLIAAPCWEALASTESPEITLNSPASRYFSEDQAFSTIVQPFDSQSRN